MLLISQVPTNKTVGNKTKKGRRKKIIKSTSKQQCSQPKPIEKDSPEG